MKLAVITDAPELWGAENSLVDLMSRASHFGISATILAPRASPIHAHPRLRSKTGVLELPQHPALKRGGLRRATVSDIFGEVVAVSRGARRIRGVLSDYDAVLSFRLWRNLETVIAGRSLGKPVMVDLHETFEGRAGKLLSTATLRGATAILAPSRDVALRSGVSERNVHVIPRAMAFDRRPGSSRDADRLVVGLFGQLREHKGHRLAIDAVLEASADIPVELRIYGSGGDSLTESYVVNATSDHPTVVKRFPFTADPLGAMAGCHIILNCSSHEAFGRTVIEGLSVGCFPVVTGGGPAEIVNYVGVGAICEPSTDSLAAAFVDSWRKPDLLARAQESGPVAVGELYALERVAEGYFGALLGALGLRPRTGPAEVS